MTSRITLGLGATALSLATVAPVTASPVLKFVTENPNYSAADTYHHLRRRQHIRGLYRRF